MLNWDDILSVFHSPDGDGGGGATDPPPKTVAAPPAGGAPAVAKPPTAPSPTLKTAGDAFKKAASDAALSKPDLKKPDGTPADPAVDPAVDPAADPAADPNADPGTPDPAADVPLTDEDRALIDREIKGVESEQRQLATLQAWCTGVTPNTREYLNGLRAERDAKEALKATPEVIATASPVKGKAAEPVVETVAIQVPKSYVSISNIETTEYKPAQIDGEWLRTHGLDPNAIDAKVAPAIAALIKERNEMARNAEIIMREAKKAFTNRDKVKGQLFERDFRKNVEDAGIVWDDSVSSLTGAARKLATVNGEPQPWAGVMSKLSEKHPRIMAKAGETPTSSPTVKDAGKTVPTTATVPLKQGTRTTTGDQHVAPTDSTKPKSYGSLNKAGAGLAKALRNKSGGLSK